MPNTSLNTTAIDFKTLEKIIFKYVCRIGRMLLVWLLKEMDRELMRKRDKKKYRHKGLKKTSIKTILGPVEFKRAIYEHKNEEGQKGYICLLDKHLKLETIGLMSPNLVEKTIENVTNASYRKAAENVTKLTGQTISHTAAWNLTQEVGNRITQEEKRRVKEYKAGKATGKKKVGILFEEADGLWLSMQGEEKPKGHKRKKKEIKLAVSYEGWERRSGKKEAYRVKNKKAVAGFMTAKEFGELRNAKIAQTYDIAEIDIRVLNGDGASWIKSGLDIEGTHFQLDEFHISKAVTSNIYDKKEAVRIRRLLKEGQVEKALTKIEQLKYKCDGEKEKIKKLMALERYLWNNKEGIKRYKDRAEIKVPSPPGELHYRSLGTMESNIFNILGYRMKGRKMSWSTSGANNMAKILAAKASGELYQAIESLMTPILPERFLERFKEKLKQVTNKVRKTTKAANQYKIHRGGLPLNRQSVTNGRAAVLRMFNDRAATELIYR